MSHLFSLLRLLILVLSFCGYIQTVRKRIKLELSVGVVFSAIGSVMYFAGILNILPETTAVVCLIGVYLAVRSFRRKDDFKQLISAGTVFFGVSCVCFYLLLHGSIFTHYDNFSHWALATKVLLQKDRFPNYSDINILFQSYPLGYASFIYYVTKVIGIQTEWIQMYAQAIFMSGILTGLFAFSKSWPQKFLVAAACVLLLAGNTNFTDLLVDTLLPITALGGILFCLYYRDKLYENLFWIIPYTVYLVSIKNSGLFFALVILAYLLTKVRSFTDVKRWIFMAVFPVGTLLLWQKHIKLVFDNGLMSYHSMSLDYFKKVFEGKEPEDIGTILGEFLRKTFSVYNEALFVCAILLIAFGLYMILVRKSGSGFRELCILIIFSYLSYQIMLFCMYLFTMPVKEALQLAEYTRYHDTILIFISGIALISVLLAMDQLPANHRRLSTALVSVLCVCCLYCSVTPKISFYTKQDPNADVRGMFRLQYEEMIEEYHVPPNSRYAVLIRSDPNSFYTGFLKYITRYLLDPVKVTIEAVDEFDKDAIAAQYDYLIVFDTTDDVVAYMEQNFTNQASQRVIRLPGK